MARLVRITLLAARRGDLVRGASFTRPEGSPDIAQYRGDPAWQVQTVSAPGPVVVPQSVVAEGTRHGHAIRGLLDAFARQLREMPEPARVAALAALGQAKEHTAPLSPDGGGLHLGIRLCLPVGGRAEEKIEASSSSAAQPPTTPASDAEVQAAVLDLAGMIGEADAVPGPAPVAPPPADPDALDQLRRALADSRATVAQVLRLALAVPVPGLRGTPKRADLWAACNAFLDQFPTPTSSPAVDPSDLGEE